MLPAFELFGERRQILLQRYAGIVLAEENVAAPTPDARFGQFHVLVLEMAEVPAAGNFLQRAVGVPSEAMERAFEVL